MTCRGQILTCLQQELRAARARLTAAVAEQLPLGSPVTVLDGAGRSMPGSVVSHGSGDSAGYLVVLPDRHKYPPGHRHHRRSLRNVHWTDIDLEGSKDD